MKKNLKICQAASAARPKSSLTSLAFKVGNVYSGQRGVVSKIESFFIESLTIDQSGELVAVAEAKLNLKPSAVDVIDVIDVFTADGSVGGEIEPMVSVGQTMNHQADFLFEQPAPCDEFVGFALGGIDVDALHPGFVGIGEINLAVLVFGSASFAGTRTIVLTIYS